MRVRSGECVLESDTRQLSVRGRPFTSSQGLQFLVLLLENRPKALSKSEIHERLWPGTSASNGTLAACSWRSDPRSGKVPRAPFVRTVHRSVMPSVEERKDLQDNVPAFAGQKLVYRLLRGDREMPCSQARTFSAAMRPRWSGSKRARVAPARAHRDR